MSHKEWARRGQQSGSASPKQGTRCRGGGWGCWDLREEDGRHLSLSFARKGGPGGERRADARSSEWGGTGTRRGDRPSE